MARAARAAAGIPAGAVLPSQRIARFFERRLTHGKGEFAGRPFLLEPWQLEVIRGIYDPLVVSRGALVREVREAVVGVGKKAGKTTWAAGLGAYHLYADGYWLREGSGWAERPTLEIGAEVYNVAASKDQARILFRVASGFVQRDPILRAMSRVYRDAIEVPETESVWRVIAADARLAHGPNPSAAIIDELWAHRDAELYEAFASAGAARRQPLVLTITTAGWDQDSIAYRMYLAGRRWERSKRPSRSFFFRWYQGPDGCKIDDLEAARAANPSRWVSLRYLRGELARARRHGLELQYRRWHLNQWTGTKEQAYPLELWDTCAARPKIPAGASVVVAVDAAPKRDSTGIAIDHKDDKGIHHARVMMMRADPETGYLDFTALEDRLREICRTYTVKRILVDPAYMIRSMLLLADEGLPIEEFPQHDSRMVPASMALYELLIDGRIRHGGDAELRAQVAAAGKKITARGFRIHKLRSTGVIDGLTALVIAVYEHERELQEPAPEPTPNIRLFEI